MGQNHAELDNVVASQRLRIIRIRRVELWRAQVFQTHVIASADPRLRHDCQRSVNSLHGNFGSFQCFNQIQGNLGLNVFRPYSLKKLMLFDFYHKQEVACK